MNYQEYRQWIIGLKEGESWKAIAKSCDISNEKLYSFRVVAVSSALIFVSINESAKISAFGKSGSLYGDLNESNVLQLPSPSSDDDIRAFTEMSDRAFFARLILSTGLDKMELIPLEKLREISGIIDNYAR